MAGNNKMEDDSSSSTEGPGLPPPGMAAMSGPQGLTRRGSRSAAMMTMSMEVFDNEVVPSSLAGMIAPILRVAAEVDAERPRVAYLCRFYAFEKAHRLDPSSSGRGVRQFKTGLLQRLERDNAPSLAKRVKKSDAREIESFYQQYYENYVRALDKGEQADRAQLGKAYQTAGVLFEVLCAVNKNEKVEEVAPEIIAAARDVQEKKEIYVPYNILPLDVAGASQPIMQLEEVKASVSALRNTRGLSWPSSFEQQRQKTGDLDLLDWLRAMFGFQRDNVRNQREHLILMLSNVHIRLTPKPEPLNKLDERAVDAIMNKIFKNYKAWCKFLGRKHSLRLPQGQPEMQQRKILYMGLYLLIWGEAANIRFMPECLCYIFHNMAYELHGLLAGNVSIVTGENIRPSYGGDDEAFLKKVVTPIYRVIDKEAKKGKHGKAPHSAWCNYDDLNEYFWTSDCFSLGWPMRDDGDFFKSTMTQAGRAVHKTSGKSTGKSNFVETRTFWHIFRSFDRMWTFYVLALQAMAIIAWSERNSVKEIFQTDTLYNISSIFITAACLRLLQIWYLDAVNGKEDGLLHTTCGTPNYVAPEVLGDKGYDGTTSDIWSCGVILFVLMAGYLPFDEPNLMALYKKIWKADFTFPSWFTSGAKKLLKRILDPNPQTRITIPEILTDEWFKKGYMPPNFQQSEEVSLDDVDAVFNDTEEYHVTEKKEKPNSMNAFALISSSQGFNLGNLFEKQTGVVKRETRFTSQCPPNVIMSKIEETAKPLGFNVKKHNYKMKLKGDRTGRKGHLSVATEVFEVAPSLHVVELRKTGGDTLEFHKFYKSFSSGLKDIVWKSEANT